MEIIFYGNKKKINIKYFFIFASSMALNYLIYRYLKDVNIFVPTMSLLLLFISVKKIRQAVKVFSGKKFKEFLNCDFLRVKSVLLFFTLIYMAISINLVNQSPINIFNFDFLFVQRAIAIALFLVCIMIIDMTNKTISIDFEDKYFYEEIDKKEFLHMEKKRNPSILDINIFAKRNQIFFRKFLSPNKINEISRDAKVNTVRKEHLAEIHEFFRDLKVIDKKVTIDIFLSNFLNEPIILKFSVPALRDFYNKFYAFNSHLHYLKPKEFTRLFINAKTGDFYDLMQFSNDSNPESRYHKKISDFFGNLK